MTMKSAQRSLKRMNVSYVDVLQLHDPEFEVYRQDSFRGAPSYYIV
jgi:aryl-alcohol dehydrogenase-like predicted oxidoreductase